MATATQEKASREHRFKKVFLDNEGTEVDDIDAAFGLGVMVDGTKITFSLEDLNENTYKRLVLDGLYDKLTRAVHASKPKAKDTDSAVNVMEEAFAQLKSGKFRKSRAGGTRGNRVFDIERFKRALIAGANAAFKGTNRKISDAKVHEKALEMQSMSGKERQKYLQKNYLINPYFKIEWERELVEKKKKAIKEAGDTAFSDLI